MDDSKFLEKESQVKGNLEFMAHDSEVEKQWRIDSLNEISILIDNLIDDLEK